MVAKSIAKMYTNIHKPTDYNTLKHSVSTLESNCKCCGHLSETHTGQ